MTLHLEHIEFSFGNQPLFMDFSLVCRSTEPIAILGPSGCGKTSLLRLMAGLLPPASGTVRHEEGPAGSRMSMVFQEPRLLPWASLEANVALPLLPLMGKAAARRRARDFLAMVGLADKAASLPDQVSGGQRQRASLARAFAWPSGAIMLDEPFQSLDLPLRIQLMDLVLSLNAAEQRLLVLVTHDPREAIYLADRMVVLGGSPARAVLDLPTGLSRTDRAYDSPVPAALEARIFSALVGATASPGD